jgi:hypothetical protein
MRTKTEKIILIRAGLFCLFFLGMFVCDWRILMLVLACAMWYFPPYIEAIFLVSFYGVIYANTRDLLTGMIPTILCAVLVWAVARLRGGLRN